jgi:hypothetical protein
MNNLSVIIPSRMAPNFIPCADALRQNEPDAIIRLIDDGMDLSWLPRDGMGPCIGYKAKKPFIFARNVNLGIRESGTDDIVILNDDALLKTPGGFSLLQRVAEEHPDYGVIASTTNNVGNLNQIPRGIGLRDDPRMVCFVCVLIPRRTIDLVGLLDERYVGYGFEDDDYCLRVRNAGLKIGIHDGCFVDHKHLPSTFRGSPTAAGDLKQNAEIFKTKWGMDNHGRPCA